MKKMFLLAVIGLGLTGAIQALEGEVYDVTITPSKDWTCDMPTTRAGGEALPASEITEIQLFVGQDTVEGKAPVMTNVGANCDFTVDFTKFPLGQHYAWVRAVAINDVDPDLPALVSDRSNIVPFALAKPSRPNAPTAGRFAQ